MHVFVTFRAFCFALAHATPGAAHSYTAVLLRAEVRDSFRRKGNRQAVYNVAGAHQAHYTTSPKENSIRYDAEEKHLIIELAFEQQSSAHTFFNSLNALNPTGGDGVVILKGTCEYGSKLTLDSAVFAQDYRALQFDSPEGSRDSVASSAEFRLGGGKTQSIKIFQSLQPREIESGPGFECCHIKDKAVSVGKDKTDINNFLAMSPSLHAMYDGNRAINPRMVIDFLGCDAHGPIEYNDGVGGTEDRHRVFLSLKWHSQMARAGYKEGFKDGVVSVDGGMEQHFYVDVLDVAKFKAFVDWKAASTREKWSPQAPGDHSSEDGSENGGDGGEG